VHREQKHGGQKGFLAVYQQPVSLDQEFGNLLGTYLSGSEIGQAWLATTLAAAVLTVLWSAAPAVSRAS